MSIICCGTKASRISSYKPHHTPPWLLSLFFALQHLLVQTSLLCTCHNLLYQNFHLSALDQSHLLASSLFACGISTSLQSGLGTRLPLVQSPTFELLVPAVILSRHSATNRTMAGVGSPGQENCTGIEQLQSDIQQIREVSGALLVSGLLKVLTGTLGLWGWILQSCGPMVIAPVLSILGLSCYKSAAQLCSFSWSISMGLIAATTFLSQNLHSLHFPVYIWNKKGGDGKKFAPVFRMLSMFLPISCIWIVCTIWVPHEQTEFPSEFRLAQNTSGCLTRMFAPPHGGNATELAPWFQFPSIGAWGWPRFSLETLSMGVAMTLTSSLSSLGCYILCARMLCCPPVPFHSCNRGICMEGIGNILSGVLGSVCGVGSNIPSAGVIGITQVGSRHSGQLSALLFLVLGCSPKLAQMLMTIPFAVHGGTLCLTFSMAVGGGVAYFQYANIDSGRNIFIVGFTMFMALLVPRWLDAMPAKIDTGWPAVDMLLLSLQNLEQRFHFSFLATTGRTLKERGLHESISLWPPTFGENTLRGQEEQLANAYSLPPVVARFFPTVYPFNQLCPPPSETEVITVGEDHKLLPVRAPVTDGEQA
ncbi:PREDICTED: solute carrier family 23 member 3 [Nanorana parkeri]|uniref:solute carrier family 23 member 3 n=1 Tax=Nanorana parkeri TaxID=125878 RepID=UPI000854B35C|nr:PREDICTED: solute carrier family 23 member 3 [Nanorana parkeri]